MDEVRISSIARSPDWVLAEYRNQSSPSTFYTVGSESQLLDTTLPVVTAFVIPSAYNNLTVPITAFTATDNVGVTGYLVNESPSTPSLSDPNWSVTPQTQYTFPSDGSKTLYAWAKDAAGNISNSLSATVGIVILVDMTPPTVTAFTIPANSSSRTVPITAFTATDNVGVTGYLVNESPSTPSLGDPNWSVTPQTQYTFPSDGSKTLYAWAKDAAGYISSSLSATVAVAAGRTYIYDELNRLIQVIFEDGRRVTYTYDASGNRMTVTNE